MEREVLLTDPTGEPGDVSPRPRAGLVVVSDVAHWEAAQHHGGDERRPVEAAVFLPL